MRLSVEYNQISDIKSLIDFLLNSKLAFELPNEMINLVAHLNMLNDFESAKFAVKYFCEVYNVDLECGD